MHVQAGNASETVMEAYHEAASFAEESGNLKHQVSYTRVHKINNTCTIKAILISLLGVL